MLQRIFVLAMLALLNAVALTLAAGASDTIAKVLADHSSRVMGFRTEYDKHEAVARRQLDDRIAKSVALSVQALEQEAGRSIRAGDIGRATEAHKAILGLDPNHPKARRHFEALGRLDAVLKEVASKGAPASATGTAKSGPPADAVEFEGRRYKLFEKPATWHVAKSQCEQMGGRLCIVRNPQQNRFIVGLSKGNVVQLGATDEEEEGHWKWVDGTPLTYANWKSGGPDNWGVGQHLLALDGAKGTWDDVASDARRMFVCEWD